MLFSLLALKRQCRHTLNESAFALELRVLLVLKLIFDFSVKVLSRRKQTRFFINVTRTRIKSVVCFSKRQSTELIGNVTVCESY